MEILELFCGNGSFSKVAEEFGHTTFTVDFDKKFNPDLCIDVLSLEADYIHFKPDVIWASPPCTEYSHAKRRGVRNIEYANRVVQKTLSLIKELNPKIWIIENPQTGLLKDQPFMANLPFIDVSYCKYGMPYRKQTRIWTNLKFDGKTCHKDCEFIRDGKHIHSVGNARKKYTERSYSQKEKYLIPKDLCIELIKQCELTLNKETALPPRVKTRGIRAIKL